MSVRSQALICCLLTGFFLLQAGCHEKSGVVEHREVVVDESPPPTGVYVVHEAPPPVIVERRPPPPAGHVIWVEGYWIREHDKYVWHKGRYIHAVAGHRHVPAHWERTKHGWEFREERWVKN